MSGVEESELQMEEMEEVDLMDLEEEVEDLQQFGFLNYLQIQ